MNGTNGKQSDFPDVRHDAIPLSGKAERETPRWKAS